MGYQLIKISDAKNLSLFLNEIEKYVENLKKVDYKKSEKCINDVSFLIRTFKRHFNKAVVKTIGDNG